MCTGFERLLLSNTRETGSAKPGLREVQPGLREVRSSWRSFRPMMGILLKGRAQ
jgi:hypothetical protein